MRDYRQALTFSLNTSCALTNEEHFFPSFSSNRPRPKQKYVHAISSHYKIRTKSISRTRTTTTVPSPLRVVSHTVTGQLQ